MLSSPRRHAPNFVQGFSTLMNLCHHQTWTFPLPLGVHADNSNLCSICMLFVIPEWYRKPTENPIVTLFNMYVHCTANKVCMPCLSSFKLHNHFYEITKLILKIHSMKEMGRKLIECSFPSNLLNFRKSIGTAK